jgi:hypothetical protein
MIAAPARLGRILRSRRRLLGSIAGIALLVAAVWAAAGDAEAWRAVASARADWRLWGVAISLPALNWLVISLSFWALLSRYGRIEATEMTALIGSAWLLNYLPMRPGLVGRLAYHKIVNQIPVRAAAGVTILGMVATGFGALLLLAVAGALGADAGGGAWTLGLVLPAVILGAGTLALWARGGELWRLGVVLALRYVDVLIWAGRYVVSFALIGSPIAVETALALAIVSQIAMLVPIAGNGLGLREWAIGLTAAYLTAVDPQAGLAADLVNRAVEVLVAVPVGLLSARVVSRRLKATLERRKAAAPAPKEDPEESGEGGIGAGA